MTEPSSPFSLFISDLHLTLQRDEANDRFFRFLRDDCPGADGLYILGDFFEAWVGDDDLAEPLHSRVAAALRALSRSGTQVHVMSGNRDFLLGEDFYAACAALPLADPSVLDLHGQPTLLLHGDTLCSDDLDYLQFRAMVRDPAWQQAFLARSLAERHALARELRARSEDIKENKPPRIMDANLATVAEAFRRHAVARMIHGHTHRSAHHLHDVDGRRSERWVLPDWYEGGGYLRCDPAGCRLVYF